MGISLVVGWLTCFCRFRLRAFGGDGKGWCLGCGLAVWRPVIERVVFRCTKWIAFVSTLIAGTIFQRAA